MAGGMTNIGQEILNARIAERYEREHPMHMDFLTSLANHARLNEPVSGARLAAGVVHRGRLLSMGCNSYKSSPFQARYSKSPESIYFHAETNAIKKVLNFANPSLLEKCTLYVCRITKNNEWAMAKSCTGCQSCIEAFNIPLVVYTINVGEYSMDAGYEHGR